MKKNGFKKIILATTTNICGSTYKTLLHLENPPATGTTFTYYTFTYVATQSCVTLSFGFRNDFDYWILDDILVSNGIQNLVINGDFEDGLAYTGWQGANHLSSMNCHSGSYCYYDGNIGSFDYLNQSLSLIIGETYSISFYLALGAGSSSAYANITISH